MKINIYEKLYDMGSGISFEFKENIVVKTRGDVVHVIDYETYFAHHQQFIDFGKEQQERFKK